MLFIQYCFIHSGDGGAFFVTGSRRAERVVVPRPKPPAVPRRPPLGEHLLPPLTRLCIPAPRPARRPAVASLVNLFNSCVPLANNPGAWKTPERVSE